MKEICITYLHLHIRDLRLHKIQCLPNFSGGVGCKWGVKERIEIRNTTPSHLILNNKLQNKSVHITKWAQTGWVELKNQID